MGARKFIVSGNMVGRKCIWVAHCTQSNWQCVSCGGCGTDVVCFKWSVSFTCRHKCHYLAPSVPSVPSKLAMSTIVYLNVHLPFILLDATHATRRLEPLGPWNRKTLTICTRKQYLMDINNVYLYTFYVKSNKITMSGCNFKIKTPLYIKKKF